MFNLEKSLSAWRRSLEYNRAFSAEDLDELEQHLRDQVQALVVASMTEEAAFGQALRDIGDYGTAETEYRKVYWGKLRRRHQLLYELQWRLSMLKNYLVIAARTLRRRKGYAFLNIIGLAVGLACFILILLFVQHELSYDRFYKKADRIFRIVQRQPGYVELGSSLFATTPAPLASTLIDEYPDVTVATPVLNRSALLSFNDRHLMEDGLWANAHFFDVFAVPLLHGNSKTALARPRSIVLTESLARKLFSDQHPMGQILLYQDQVPYTVTGVIPDVPENSSLRYTFITDFPLSEIYYENVWHSNNTHTFFLLAIDTDEAQFQAKLPALVEKYLYEDSEDVAEESRIQYLVQPLTDIHLRSQQVNFDFGNKGEMNRVYLFAAIGFLILLLACVNYTNLAVALSIKRAREVGMRKAVGAQRGQIIGQFLGESVLMTFLALVLALGLAVLLLPSFGHLVDRPIRTDFLGNRLLFPGLLALVALVGLVSGSYPAFYMASLRPMQVLTGKADGGPSRFRVQRLLIVGQFAVSIALVSGSFVVYEQMQYVQHKDLGYDREHVITVRMSNRALRENYALIRSEWLRDPHVVAVTSSLELPTDVNFSQQISGWLGSSVDDHLNVRRMNVDYDFLDVFAMELAAGRTFSRQISGDTLGTAMINETAARALGWTPEAIDKHFKHMGDERAVIGVVKDFHMRSMHQAIEPLLILLNPGGMRYISAKVRPDDLPGTIGLFEKTIKQFSPYPFEYQFLDESFDELYKKEVRLGETFGFFTVLALLIASLGLFGLAAFAAEQRTKEIGVRKVLGANVTGLVALLSKDFLKLVGIAFIVSAPVAFFAMQRWLEDFAYRVELGPSLFFLAGGVALALALLAVSYQSIKAAVADPIKSLRYE